MSGSMYSTRSGAGYLATPTATSKRKVTPASILELDARGQVVGGRGKVFGEIGLHLACLLYTSPSPRD